MFTAKEIPLDQITVGSRARKYLGDIEALKTSIQKNKLLYPILITEDFTLIAGGRRLQAHKELELPTIACRIIPNVNAEEKLILELVDNEDREDFTWSEAVSLKLQIHELMVTTNEKWGYRDTAYKLNVSLGGLSSDLTIAKTFKEHPELADYPTKVAAQEQYKLLQKQTATTKIIKDLNTNDQAKLTQLLGEQRNIPTKERTKTKEPTIPSIPAITREERTIKPPPPPAPIAPIEPPTLPEYTYQTTDFKTFIRKIPDNIVGFAELDPPTDWSIDKLKASMEWLFKHIHSKLMDDSWILCWTSKEYFTYMNSLASNAGFSTQMPGICTTPRKGTNISKTTMTSQYEMFLLFSKNKAQFNTPSFPNVLQSSIYFERGNQWEKPIELYNTFMQACAKPGAIFLSPFAGSGMSMISACINGMTPMGCDPQQKHFYRFLDVFKERCEKVP